MNDEAVSRREKLKQLKDAGVDPYPARVERDKTVREFLATFETLEKSGAESKLVGRVRMVRAHGGLTFAHIEDGTERVQIALRRDTVGAEKYQAFQKLVDLGDFIGVRGKAFVTRVGERSLDVAEYTMLAKALLPLPEKWHGLSDAEIRYRQRELDLVANPEVRAAFKKRTLLIRALREALDAEGFEEVETPILQPIPGGATARPFVTHHNALDIDLYLRIAPELYLKRLIVGGYEKVYEIGRQFRNEGIDWTHNPEFTSLEFYWAYQDYRGLMDFTERLLQGVVEKVNGGSLKLKYRGAEIDFAGQWPRVTFREAIKKACGLDIVKLDQPALVGEMKKLKLDFNPEADLGKLYDELYKETVRKKQVQPIFIVDYPVEMEPLAKRCADDPRFVQRFQIIAGGLELLKAFSELNDPIDQLKRFEEQQKLREQGDDEAQHIDTAFVEALEHGLPPTAGWGMGIDRFAMMLTDSPSVKEIILFPTLRPIEGSTK